MSDAVLLKQQEKINSPLDNFLSVNAARMKRVQSSLGIRKQSFLDALPMLFHTNDDSLPGFISKNTPHGLPQYSPTGKTLYETRRIAKNKSIGKRAPKKFEILGLYFMGSAGTISYNGESDFDIWVFVKEEIENTLLLELGQKTRLIEEWAAKSQIEVHFHVVDPVKFRSGETSPLSAESSGTAQHGLLLDEFYRSSIMIAGQPLAWWFVPPEQETQFEMALKNQKYLGNTSINSTINLGGLAKIAPQEYFGAAMWQLNKSIKSPYKSVLKLLLMEVYAHDRNGENLISHRFKKNVYAGISSISLLDPWLLMFEQVEEYLQDQKDEVRLQILRRSFYLKVNEKLSDDLCFHSWKRTLLTERVTSWNWEEDQISALDQRESWKLETVLQERATLVSTLTKSFRFLSRDLNKISLESQISQDDLTVLGRRLYSAFERKTGKVEMINNGISPDINESTVSLHLLESADLPSSWVLYRGIVTANSLGDSTHLKSAPSLIEIVSWCYFNEILNDESKIMLYLPAYSSVTEYEIKTLLDALRNQFPEEILNANDDALSQPVQLKSVALFVNTGLQPKAATVLANTQLSSKRDNALSFGGQHENLTITFDLVYTTTWGETFIQHYSGTNGLMDCLAEFISWSTESTKLLKVYCYSPGYGTQIKNTLNGLFNDIIERSFSTRGSSENRYILEVEDHYQCIEINENLLSYKTITNDHDLMNYLAKYRSNFSPVYFNPYSCQHTMLPVIYGNNKKGSLQLFFYLKDNTANIYVLDEKGTLSFRHREYSNRHSLFGQYKLFADNIIEQVEYNDLTSLLSEDKNYIDTEMYLIMKDHSDDFSISPLLLIMEQATRFVSLQLLFQIDDSGSEQITIYCEDQEFSSLQYKDDLYHQIALHLFKLHPQKVPSVYITDIALSQTMLDKQDQFPYQSSHYFKYKNLIETKLFSALTNLL